MEFRERHNEENDPHAGSPNADPGGGLNQMRQTAQHLFQAADDAIARALAGDSQAFLDATRQEGGE